MNDQMIEKCIINLSQVNSEGNEVTTSVTVNVVMDSERFSGKVFRKAIQVLSNRLLSQRKLGGVSRGKRFKLSANFMGFELTEVELFYNSSEKVRSNFNRDLKDRLQLIVTDVKELIAEQA